MVGLIATRTPPSSESKPTLHVECCTIKPEPSPAILASQVDEWLRLNRATVGLSELLVSFSGLNDAQKISFVRIGDISTTADADLKRMITLADITIDVDVFHFIEVEDAESAGRLPNVGIFGPEEDHGAPQARIISLPNKTLNGLWDSLIFDDPVQFQLLRFILRMVSFSGRQLQRDRLASWNRTILLYGEPGTGKTTLCRALAQQISIRLGKTFPKSKLIEINAHSLFSKYFSESGKAVSKVFKTIELMLDEEVNTFVCVFIDEIESLASTRQHSARSSEPQDSLRAVNALLIALDSLHTRPNVAVLCTSNLIKAMDPAFLDRVDEKLYIPEPGPEARYEIFRTCYLGLADSGIISRIDKSNEEELLDFDYLVDGSPEPFQEPSNAFGDSFMLVNKNDLPTYNLMLLHYYGDKSSWPRKLWDIAERSASLSGRTLHRLPILSLAKYSTQDPCPMDQALEALSKAVDNELLTQQRIRTDQAEGSDKGSGGRRMLFA